MDNKKYLFEEMPVGKALLSMAVPTIVSQLINLVYNVVDAMFIGQTGDAYKTAAVTLSFPIFMMTVTFCNLFGIGGGSLMARLSGQGKPERAKGVSALAFYGGMTVALIYSLLIGLFLEPVLTFMGASENTMVFAKQYVSLVVVLGTPPIVLSGVMAHLLRNLGCSRQAGIGLSLGGILNIILDPICMFVIFPKGMEVFGAALATLISNIIACIFLLTVVILLSRQSAISLNIRNVFLVNSSEIKSFFGVGVPSSLLTGLFDIANVVLTILTAAHGDLELAAMGIVMKAERLPNAMNIGLCQGMLPLVAYNYASGNHERMKKVISATRRYGLTISAIAIVLFELFARPVCSVFMNTGSGANAASAAATVALAVSYLRLRCLASPVQFLNYSTSFSMQAVGYGSGTMLHSCFRILLFYIPAMFILDRAFGMYGLVSALGVGEAFGAAFALLLFKRWLDHHSLQ